VGSRDAIIAKREFASGFPSRSLGNEEAFFRGAKGDDGLASDCFGMETRRAGYCFSLMLHRALIAR